MAETQTPAIAIASAEEIAARLDAYAGLLHACVHGGASVNFVLPFAMAQAAAFWNENALPAVRAGPRTVAASHWL